MNYLSQDHKLRTSLNWNWYFIEGKSSLLQQRNEKLKFDLSDTSLSFVVSGVRSSVFELRFFTDSDYSNIFDTTETRSTFEVTRSGNLESC